MGKFVWNGAAARKLIEEKTQRKINAAAILVTSHAKKLISVPGTGERRGGNVTPTRSGSRARRIYGAFPSAPGEPPHKQTGRLRGSVTWEPGKLRARVGTNVKYGRYLELGSGRLKPRPWLKRSLAEMAASIRALFARKS